jgi:hypothetical protein
MKAVTERVTYLADTYALIETAKGNKHYLQYQDYTLVTTQLNLIEAYHNLIQDCGEAIAD